MVDAALSEIYKLVNNDVEALSFNSGSEYIEWDRLSYERKKREAKANGNANKEQSEQKSKSDAYWEYSNNVDGNLYRECYNRADKYVRDFIKEQDAADRQRRAAKRANKKNSFRKSETATPRSEQFDTDCSLLSQTSSDESKTYSEVYSEIFEESKARQEKAKRIRKTFTSKGNTSKICIEEILEDDQDECSTEAEWDNDDDYDDAEFDDDDSRWNYDDLIREQIDVIKSYQTDPLSRFRDYVDDYVNEVNEMLNSSESYKNHKENSEENSKENTDGNSEELSEEISEENLEQNINQPTENFAENEALSFEEICDEVCSEDVESESESELEISLRSDKNDENKVIEILQFEHCEIFLSRRTNDENSKEIYTYLEENTLLEVNADDQQDPLSLENNEENEIDFCMQNETSPKNFEQFNESLIITEIFDCSEEDIERQSNKSLNQIEDQYSLNPSNAYSSEFSEQNYEDLISKHSIERFKVTNSQSSRESELSAHSTDKSNNEVTIDEKDIQSRQSSSRRSRRSCSERSHESSRRSHHSHKSSSRSNHELRPDNEDQREEVAQSKRSTNHMPEMTLPGADEVDKYCHHSHRSSRRSSHRNVSENCELSEGHRSRRSSHRNASESNDHGSHRSRRSRTSDSDRGSNKSERSSRKNEAIISVNSSHHIKEPESAPSQYETRDSDSCCSKHSTRRSSHRSEHSNILDENKESERYSNQSHKSSRSSDSRKLFDKDELTSCKFLDDHPSPSTHNSRESHHSRHKSSHRSNHRDYSVRDDHSESIISECSSQSRSRSCFDSERSSRSSRSSHSSYRSSSYSQSSTSADSYDRTSRHSRRRSSEHCKCCTRKSLENSATECSTGDSYYLSSRSASASASNISAHSSSRRSRSAGRKKFQDRASSPIAIKSGSARNLTNEPFESTVEFSIAIGDDEDNDETKESEIYLKLPATASSTRSSHSQDKLNATVEPQQSSTCIPNTFIPHLKIYNIDEAKLKIPSNFKGEAIIFDNDDEFLDISLTDDDMQMQAKLLAAARNDKKRSPSSSNTSFQSLLGESRCSNTSIASYEPSERFYRRTEPKDDDDDDADNANNDDRHNDVAADGAQSYSKHVSRLATRALSAQKEACIKLKPEIDKIFSDKAKEIYNSEMRFQTEKRKQKRAELLQQFNDRLQRQLKQIAPRFQ